MNVTALKKLLLNISNKDYKLKGINTMLNKKSVENIEVTGKKVLVP